MGLSRFLTLSSLGGFSETAKVFVIGNGAPWPHFSSCGLLSESAKHVNTHQLSGRCSCPLQVLTVNPGGGKVNKSPSDNTAQTICNQNSVDHRVLCSSSVTHTIALILNT